MEFDESQTIPLPQLSAALGNTTGRQPPNRWLHLRGFIWARSALTNMVRCRTDSIAHAMQCWSASFTVSSFSGDVSVGKLRNHVVPNSPGTSTYWP